MPTVTAIARVIALVLTLASCGVTSEEEAEAVYQKHRVWFEYVVRQIDRSRDIGSIPPSGHPSDDEEKKKLNEDDLKIYLNVQTGMATSVVRRIAVVGVGKREKKMVSFIMGNWLIDYRVLQIAAIKPGYSISDLVSLDTTCRPLTDEGWYVCKMG